MLSLFFAATAIYGAHARVHDELIPAAGSGCGVVSYIFFVLGSFDYGAKKESLTKKVEYTAFFLVGWGCGGST
jgi:hypothetical protein